MNQWHYNKIKQLKDWKSDLNAVLVFAKTDEETRKDTVRYISLLDYAIEQIERVQELEDVNSQLKRQAPGVELELLNMELTDALKQNKRYREALEYIGNHVNDSEWMSNVVDTKLIKAIIREVLEELK